MKVLTKIIHEDIILKPNELRGDAKEKELFIRNKVLSNLLNNCSVNGYIVKIHDKMNINPMGKIMMNTGNVVFSANVKVDLFIPRVDDVYNAKITNIIDSETMFMSVYDLIEICITDSNTTKLKEVDVIPVKITNVVYEKKKFDCTGVVAK